MNLATIKPTAPLSAQVIGPFIFTKAPPINLPVQANFVYGSGSATMDVYVQTSFDAGTTWIDIMHFQFTTASARKIANVNAQTAVTTIQNASSGSSTANTVTDGLIGDRLQVQWTSSGTYSLTTLTIDTPMGLIQSR